jgi:hypothetical protein
MKHLLQKQVPVRLATRDYEELRERVRRRDGWRCQFCGSMSNLEVHHQQFRSHWGEDTEDNLITLCTNCHSTCHRWRALPSRKRADRTSPRNSFLLRMSLVRSLQTGMTNCSRLCRRRGQRIWTRLSCLCHSSGSSARSIQCGARKWERLHD